MKILRDDPIEEGIDAFFEEKQRLEEEKQKLENEIRDYEQKYLDQYYDGLEEEELSERLDYWRIHCLPDGTVEDFVYDRF